MTMRGYGLLQWDVAKLKEKKYLQSKKSVGVNCAIDRSLVEPEKDYLLLENIADHT